MQFYYFYLIFHIIRSHCLILLILHFGVILFTFLLLLNFHYNSLALFNLINFAFGLILFIYI